MTTSQVLTGAGLVLVLAVGSQVLASRFRLPSVVFTLPIGFVAGILTRDVRAPLLLGPAYLPVVSMGLSLLLYNAGLSLDLRLMDRPTRQIMTRLTGIGIAVTVGFGATAAALFLGLAPAAAVMTGAILAPSGLTVVRPLLGFVRPANRLRSALTWETALAGPVSSVVAALVFHGVIASTLSAAGNEAGDFIAGLGIGAAGGLIGVGALWLVLRRLTVTQPLGASVQLAAVVGVSAGCDTLRSGTGMVAAVIMGLAVSNLRGLDVPARRPFLDTLVQLVRGVLMVSIAAIVSPAMLGSVLLPGLGIAAVLVLVARPLSAVLATRDTDLTRRERIFAGWLAPRADVSAVLAAAFSIPLAIAGVPGSAKILPVVLLVIAVSIVFYGLAAVPAARLLGILRSPRTRPLLVGGDDWVIDLGRALQLAGLDVLMWAGLEGQRERIRQAALPLASGEILAQVAADRSELSGVTAVLLLTPEDDFNALASSVLSFAVDEQVFRLAPPSSDRGVIAPFTGGKVLFGTALNRSTMRTRYYDGSRITSHRAGCPLPPGQELLFLVRGDGRLDPVTRDSAPVPADGDMMVVLTHPEPEPEATAAGF